LKDQSNRAELLDQINTLMATGALPFAALLLLDALADAGVGSTLLAVLDWAAKGALAAVVVLLSIAVARKARSGRTAPYEDSYSEDSYSATMLRKALAASWVATFVVLTQFDSLFEGAGILGVVEMPLVHAGGIVTAFMLVVFSLTYFGLMMLASDEPNPSKEAS
jgi:Mg2+/citrate symporter